MGGIPIKDPKTGRILGTRPTTLEERYPTGRKLCTSKHHKGPRWCHLCDFSWKNNDKTIQAWCRACQRIYARKGDSPRIIIATPTARQAAQKRWYRQWKDNLMADPERYQEWLETMRLKGYDRSRAKGIPVRPRKDEGQPTYVNPDLFLEWLHWNPRAASKITDNEERMVRRLKSGESKVVNLSMVDTIMSRAGHHGQSDVLYPPGTEVNKVTGLPEFKQPRRPRAEYQADRKRKKAA